MQRALHVIRDEHRSLSAVLHALRHVSQEYASTGARPDFRLLWAMIDYVDRFPERLHHPKEDEQLFRLLRLRAPQARATLDALGAEHVEGIARIARLREILEHLEAGRVNTRDFADVARDYADFQWRHMRLEEDAVLPLAERVLTGPDWIEINAAFDANDDPLVGLDTKTSLEALYSRIVALTPGPYGLAEPTTRSGP